MPYDLHTPSRTITRWTPNDNFAIRHISALHIQSIHNTDLHVVHRLGVFVLRGVHLCNVAKSELSMGRPGKILRATKVERETGYISQLVSAGSVVAGSTSHIPRSRQTDAVGDERKSGKGRANEGDNTAGDDPTARSEGGWTDPTACSDLDDCSDLSRSVCLLSVHETICVGNGAVDRQDVLHPAQIV